MSPMKFGSVAVLLLIDLLVVDAFLQRPRASVLPRGARVDPLQAAKRIEEKEFNIDDILAEADEALRVAEEALSKGKDAEASEEPTVEPVEAPESDPVDVQPLVADLEEPPQRREEDVKAEVDARLARERQAERQAERDARREAREEARRSKESAVEVVNESEAEEADISRQREEDSVKAEVDAMVARLEKEEEARRRKEAALEGVNEVVEKGMRSLGGALSEILEGSVNSAKVVVSRQVETTVDDVKGMPSKIGETAQQKAKETANEIVGLPAKLSEAAQRKVKDIVDLPSKLLDSAKRGVSDIPTLENWRQNANGSVTGMIAGNMNDKFENGETVTTAVVRQEAIEGGMIETASGTRYYLGARAPEKAPVLDLLGMLFGGITDGKTVTPPRNPKKESKSVPAAEEKREEAEKMREAAKRAREAMDSLKEAKPRATFSLAALLGGASGFGAASRGKPKPPEPVSSPPRGLPILTKWKQNTDGSVSGLITGSSNFEEGEAVTTSPITGKAIVKAIVTTETGSRYYLDDKKGDGGLFGLFGTSFSAFKN